MTDTKTITLPDKIKSTNTLLAALRLLQAELDKNPEGHGLELFGELLGMDEINELCESINMSYPIDLIDDEALSVDEIYDRAHQIKALMRDHYKPTWTTDDNNDFEYDGLTIHHDQYVAMNFILKSNAIVEDETNTNVYVKTTFTIDAKDLSLSIISTLSCCETGDACDLPVSLALQKEVNTACELMIKEQLAVLSENNIQLLSADTKNYWQDDSLLETASDKFKELCGLLETHYTEHPNLKNMDNGILSNGFNGGFLEGDFAVVFNYESAAAPLDQYGNRTGINIVCSTTLNKGDREDFHYKVNSNFSASLRSLSNKPQLFSVGALEVPILLHQKMTLLCETLAEAQQAFLASHGIELSVNATPVWRFNRIENNNNNALADEVSEDEDDGHRPS